MLKVVTGREGTPGSLGGRLEGVAAPAQKDFTDVGVQAMVYDGLNSRLWFLEFVSPAILPTAGAVLHGSMIVRRNCNETIFIGSGVFGGNLGSWCAS